MDGGGRPDTARPIIGRLITALLITGRPMSSHPFTIPRDLNRRDTVHLVENRPTDDLLRYPPTIISMTNDPIGWQQTGRVRRPGWELKPGPRYSRLWGPIMFSPTGKAGFTATLITGGSNVRAITGQDPTGVMSADRPPGPQYRHNHHRPDHRDLLGNRRQGLQRQANDRHQAVPGIDSGTRCSEITTPVTGGNSAPSNISVPVNAVQVVPGPAVGEVDRDVDLRACAEMK